MTKFSAANKELELKIKDLEGKGRKVVLQADDYFLLNNKTPVIKHDSLIRLSEDNGLYIDKTELEFGSFKSPDNFCFIHRAYKTLSNGAIVDEVGEANPNNLDPGIGGNYPAIMSNKRAQDRLLIRLLGLQGQVYSDAEFGGNKTDKEDRNEQSFTKKEAEALMVDFGKVYSKNPITLLELKNKDKNTFNWLLNTYKITPRSSDKMKKLHKGAKVLASVM